MPTTFFFTIYQSNMAAIYFRREKYLPIVKSLKPVTPHALIYFRASGGPVKDRPKLIILL
jgi:hypothetical protein